MQTADLIVEHGYLITMDPQRRLIPDGTVVVQGGRILDLGPADELAGRYAAAQRLDALGKVVLPGFIDAHAHAGHSLIKTVGSHLNSFGWLSMVDHIYFRSTGPEFWYADGLLSGLERLKFGTTCGITMLGSAPRTDRPEPAERYCEGVAEVGIRGLVGVGPPRPPWPRKFSWWEDDKKSEYTVTMEDTVQVTRQVIRSKHLSAGGLIRIYISPSRFLAVTPLDPMVKPDQLEDAHKQARLVKELVSEFGLGVHTHAWGGSVAFAHQLGLLGPHVSLGHCFAITDEEVHIMASTGAAIAYCPSARTVYDKPGRCPVPEAIAAGVTVAIASDATAPDRTFDLFKDMRMAMTLHRYALTDPFVIPEGKALEMVTIDAARALGLDQEIGSLEVGKQADIITVNLRAPHLVPSFMVPYRVVYEASGHDVSDAVVGGRLVMKDRRVLTVDERKVLLFAQEQAELVVERSGVAPLMALPERFWGHSRL